MTQQHGNKNERSCQLKCYNLIITKVRRMKDSIKQNVTIIRIIKKKRSSQVGCYNTKINRNNIMKQVKLNWIINGTITSTNIKSSKKKDIPT